MITFAPVSCRAVFLLLVSLLAGCSSLGFSSHPELMQSWKQSIAAGQARQVVTKAGEKATGGNQLLFSLEAARIAQIADQTDDSLSWFARADALFGDEDDAARIRASRLAQSTSAMITNDRALAYESEPYERIFSQTFQALNYLAKRDLTGASVEFRRADQSQRDQEHEHQRQIDKAEENNEGNVDVSQYEGYFQGLNAAAASVRSGVQNAYSFYLSGVFWEGTGEYNDALVSYKQALQILPAADFLKEDVARVSRKLDRKLDQAHGLLVVAYEQGFVPSRQSLGIPIPTVQGMVTVNFPVYDGSHLVTPVPLRVRAGDQYVSTEPVAQVGAIAARALKDKMPGILMRQIARTTAKYALQKEANSRDSTGLLGFATQLYNLLSEQADLRSWSSLPANAQVARLVLPVGEQEVALSLPNRDSQQRVTIAPNGVTLLRVIDAGGLVTVQVLPITSFKSGD